jgi:hypothetical protein
MSSVSRGVPAVAGIRACFSLRGRGDRLVRVPFRLRAVGANSQPAFGLYGRASDGTGYAPQAIQVLTLKGDRIERLHDSVRPDLFPPFGLPATLAD